MVELATHDQLPTGELARSWQELVRLDPAGTVFHTPRFLRVWLEVLGGRVLPRVRTFHRDGELVGVVGEELERVGSPTGPQRVLRFLGGTDVTDYQGPVSRAEDREVVAAAWVDALAEDREWDEVHATGVPVDAGWIEPVRARAASHGLQVEEHDEDVCPQVSLSGGYEAYLGRLPGKQRHELKRKVRKLAREVGELQLERVDDGALPGALDTFFAMARDADGEKRRFFLDERMRDFFGALADEFAPDGTFRLHTLDVAGQPAAATVSLVGEGGWGLYNSAFDQVLHHFAPGMVLVGELLREAAEQQLEVFDLLRGDEPYKYRFGAEDRVLRRLTITRS